MELDHYLTRSTYSFAEAQTYLPDLGAYYPTPDQYLDHLLALKKAVNCRSLAV